MGWLLFLVAAALSGLLLWRFGRLGKGRIELLGAALMLAIAGYAWQGNPGVAGNPIRPVDQSSESEPTPTISTDARGQFSAENMWLSQADALVRAGKTKAAVAVLTGGTKRAPSNPDLWVGLGNALTVHNQGQISPASQFAFEKAAQLSPNHPGPPFFLGLGLAQTGKLDEAGQVWRALLARAPEGAPWKADLETRLAQINQLPVQTPGQALPPPPGAGPSLPTR